MSSGSAPQSSGKSPLTLLKNAAVILWTVGSHLRTVYRSSTSQEEQRHDHRATMRRVSAFAFCVSAFLFVDMHGNNSIAVLRSGIHRAAAPVVALYGVAMQRLAIYVDAHPLAAKRTKVGAAILVGLWLTSMTTSIVMIGAARYAVSQRSSSRRNDPDTRREGGDTSYFSSSSRPPGDPAAETAAFVGYEEHQYQQPQQQLEQQQQQQQQQRGYRGSSPRHVQSRRSARTSTHDYEGSRSMDGSGDRRGRIARDEMMSGRQEMCR